MLCSNRYFKETSFNETASVHSALLFSVVKQCFMYIACGTLFYSFISVNTECKKDNFRREWKR